MLRHGAGSAVDRIKRLYAAKLEASKEASARILVAMRCKQAGMHWRIHNAACVCAILARLRSAA